MSRAPRFGRYVAVDWSARSSPAAGADSVWIAVLDADANGDAIGDVALHNPRTRHEAAALLVGSPREDVATLVGIDVGLGYPAGTADRFGLDATVEPPWSAMWRQLRNEITDDARNRNNRFEVAAALNRRGRAPGPFWGWTPGPAIDGLPPRKPAPGGLAEFRATERELRAHGRSPMSMWQLTGAGSVGSQSLTAIPVLDRWRDELGERLVVWPFACGFTEPRARPGDVVVAEVWPTQFDPPYPAGTVRDAAQVAHVVVCLAAADADGALATWFAPHVAGDVVEAAVAEEGWVLGPLAR